MGRMGSFASRGGFLLYRRDRKWGKIKRNPTKDNLTFRLVNTPEKYVGFIFKRRPSAYYGSWRYRTGMGWHKISNGFKI